MMRQMVLYLLHFLVWFTRESSSQRGSCPQDKPVLKFCTKDLMTNLTEVNIDTISVPKYQVIVCECTIFTYVPGKRYKYLYHERHIPKNVLFKIDDDLLSSAENIRVSVDDKAKLLLLTTKNYTTERACLVISTDDNHKFNITCNRTQAATSPSSKVEGTETYTGYVTKTYPYTAGNQNIGKNNFIIPVVAALSGLVVLAIVISVIIIRRRRLSKKEQPATSSSANVDKEDDDDYYMTENPMYNATDIPPKPHNSESEYQYIEHDNNNVCMSSDQYGSNPDTPLKKQLPSKEEVEDEHYDYSTCLSNNKQALKTNKAGASVPSDQSAGTENMYDRTDNTLAKPFMGENEYHHLTPTGPRRMAAVDTYNTVGSLGDDKYEQERDVDDSEYHVTSSR